MAVDWPWSKAPEHTPEQAQVNAVNGNYGTKPYTTFLLSPPAPIFDMHTTIPVANLRGFLQNDWWTFYFHKYGHAGLRVCNSTSESQLRPPLSTISSKMNNFKALLSKFSLQSPQFPFSLNRCRSSHMGFGVLRTAPYSSNPPSPRASWRYFTRYRTQQIHPSHEKTS